MARRRPVDGARVSNTDEAVAAIADACRAVVRAEETLNAAIVHRHDAIRRLWPVVYRFGPKWLAAEVGEDVITASNLRNITADMQPRPARGPFVGPEPTKDEAIAIGELKAACQSVHDARTAHDRALNQRLFTMRSRWPEVAHIGPARLERLIGREFVGESTIRNAVAELKRQRGE